jgi:hypothetical protein
MRTFSTGLLTYFILAPFRQCRSQPIISLLHNIFFYGLHEFEISSVGKSSKDKILATSFVNIDQYRRAILATISFSFRGGKVKSVVQD